MTRAEHRLIVISNVAAWIEEQPVSFRYAMSRLSPSAKMVTCWKLRVISRAELGLVVSQGKIALVEPEIRKWAEDSFF